MQIGSLVFTDSAEVNNRFCMLALDAADDKNYSISLNGTDSNGDPVFPSFVVIDNYNNENPLNYSVDNFASSLAPFTTVTLMVSKQTQRLTVALVDGQINVFISEKKLPVTEGTKYQQGSSTPPVSGKQIMFITATGNGTFVVPATWNISNNKVHCIGAGANGTVGTGPGDGGGGGAYARRNNMVLTPGVNCPYRIGISNVTNPASTFVNSVADVEAKAGSGQNNGSGTGSTGSVKKAGGTGGAGQGAGNGGGGGGAGSSTDIGVDGASGATTSIGGASGDALAGGAANTAGGAGQFWTQTSDSTKAGAGSGGGGSTLANTAGAAGGNYGAGGGGGKGTGAGGGGRQGLIVLEWTP